MAKSGTRDLENVITLHFSIFRGNLFTAQQSDNTFKLFCKSDASLDELTKRNNFKLSETSNFLECKKLRSFINNKNNNGAKCYPCGKPDGTLNGTKLEFL